MGRKTVKKMREAFEQGTGKSSSAPELQPQKVVFGEDGEVYLYFTEDLFALVAPEDAQKLIVGEGVEVEDRTLNVQSGRRVEGVRGEVTTVYTHPQNRNTIDPDVYREGDWVLMVNQFNPGLNGVFQLAKNTRTNKLKAAYLPVTFLPGDKLLNESTGDYWVLSEEGNWRPLKASDLRGK